MNKQKGFTLVEGLLIVLTLSVVGFAGYTVWNNYQDDEVEVAEARQQEQQLTEEAQEEVSTIPDGWAEYSNTDAGAAFIYPEGWEVYELSEDDRERGVIVKLVSPEQKAAHDDFAKSQRQTEGPYPYDFALSTWSTINNENARGGTSFPQEEYSSLEDFLTADDVQSKKSVGEIIISGINAFEVEVGGIGLNYAIMAERDSGIVQFSFINIWDKSGIDETTQQIIDSIELL